MRQSVSPQRQTAQNSEMQTLLTRGMPSFTLATYVKMGIVSTTTTWQTNHRQYVLSKALGKGLEFNHKEELRSGTVHANDVTKHNRTGNNFTTVAVQPTVQTAPPFCSTLVPWYVL